MNTSILKLVYLHHSLTPKQLNTQSNLEMYDNIFCGKPIQIEAFSIEEIFIYAWVMDYEAVLCYNSAVNQVLYVKFDKMVLGVRFVRVYAN